MLAKLLYIDPAQANISATIVVIIIIGVFVSFIPAIIAKKKGYGFVGFWLFGLFLFLPALIVSLCISDKNTQQQYYQPTVSSSTADELKKYDELHEQGAITDEEYAKIKTKLLS